MYVLYFFTTVRKPDPFLNFEIIPQKLCDQILTFKGDPEKFIHFSIVLYSF